MLLYVLCRLFYLSFGVTSKFMVRNHMKVFNSLELNLSTEFHCVRNSYDTRRHLTTSVLMIIFGLRNINFTNDSLRSMIFTLLNQMNSDI